MSKYKILYKKSVEKDLRSLSQAIRKGVVKKIQALASDPRPAGATKLRGADSVWRVRQGDYRIVYQIDDGVLTVLVVKIGHRREVYRELG